MRPHAFAEINVACNLSTGQIDDHHIAAIGSGLAHTGISVDRHVCEAAVGRRREFVPGYSTLGNFCQLPPCDRVNDPDAPVSFVSYEQDSILRGL